MHWFLQTGCVSNLPAGTAMLRRKCGVAIPLFLVKWPDRIQPRLRPGVNLGPDAWPRLSYSVRRPGARIAPARMLDSVARYTRA
jgi:hypothetical protein